MTSTTDRRAFILPGEEIAAKNPNLLALLQRSKCFWEDFVHLSMKSLIEHVNRGGLEDLEFARDRAKQRTMQQEIAHDETIEAIIIEVMSGIDCEAETADNPEDTYLTISTGVMDIYEMAIRFIPLIFDDQHAAGKGMIYDIRLVRTVGRDVMLEVGYLINEKIHDLRT